MAVTPAGEKHLRWCADRALAEFDHGGGAQGALASVMSDFTKHEVTAGIDPMLTIMIVGGAVEKGRAELERAIMGFNV